MITFIAIGSNLGDRYANCERAVEAMGALKGVRLLAKSKWYETEALVNEGRGTRDEGRLVHGIQMNPPFINGVVKIETELAPSKLLPLLQDIEARLGRVRTDKRWEPRVIDLDILFYGDLIIDTPTLKLPHPELHKRMFVLKPMCDIEPEWKHPVLNCRMWKLMGQITNPNFKIQTFRQRRIRLWRTK